MTFSGPRFFLVGSDFFTQEMEWLLRMRRERNSLQRLAMRAKKFVREVASTQGERDVRRWATPEAQRLFEDLDRLADFFGPGDGRYLDGDIVRKSSLPPSGPTIEG